MTNGNGKPLLTPMADKRDQADIGADHINFAVGEIDHADDAVDHRVADGDQRIDRAQRQTVEELLGKLGYELRHKPDVPVEDQPGNAHNLDRDRKKSALRDNGRAPGRRG